MHRLAVVPLLASALALGGCYGTAAATTTTAAPGHGFCTMARAYPNGISGVAVYVQTPGPDEVWVTVNPEGSLPRRSRQQLTYHDDGAQFSFLNVEPVSTITLKTKRGVACSVALPTT